MRLIAPGRLEAVEAAAPDERRLGPGEVVLRSLAGGICGSDLAKFAGSKDARLDGEGRFLPGRAGFPLHEIVGEVVASRAEGVSAGDRVVGWAPNSDGLAELVVTRGDQIAPYDEALSPTLAVIIQPLACVLYALDRVDVRDRDVAVVGLGAIGLMFAHLAKQRGARRVTGVDPVDRSPVAADCGVDRLIVGSSATWAEAALDEGPEVVIEAVGHQTATLSHAMRAARVGGSIVYFGIPDEDIYPIDMERLMRRDLTLLGGITRDRARSLRRANDYLLRHRPWAEQMITHVADRAGVQAAFDMASRPGPGRLKTVLDFTA